MSNPTHTLPEAPNAPDKDGKGGCSAVAGSFSPLMRVQREVLLMQQKAQGQGETLRRIGNSRDAAHYVTAAIVLNEVAQLIAEEVSKMNTDSTTTSQHITQNLTSESK